MLHGMSTWPTKAGMTAITHSQTISQITLCKSYPRAFKPKLIQTKLNTNYSISVLIQCDRSIKNNKKKFYKWNVHVGSWNCSFQMTKKGREPAGEQWSCGECPLSFLKVVTTIPLYTDNGFNYQVQTYKHTRKVP